MASVDTSVIASSVVVGIAIVWVAAWPPATESTMAGNVRRESIASAVIRSNGMASSPIGVPVGDVLRIRATVLARSPDS